MLYLKQLQHEDINQFADLTGFSQEKLAEKFEKRPKNCLTFVSFRDKISAAVVFFLEPGWNSDRLFLTETYGLERDIKTIVNLVKNRIPYDQFFDKTKNR